MEMWFIIYYLCIENKMGNFQTLRNIAQLLNLLIEILIIDMKIRYTETTYDTFSYRVESIKQESRNIVNW